MDISCNHITLASPWALTDDAKLIHIVEAIDALYLCRNGEYHTVPQWEVTWEFQRHWQSLAWEIGDFAAHSNLIGLRHMWQGESDKAEMVLLGIRNRQLVGVRLGQGKAVGKDDALTEQRQLIRQIEAHERMREAGRQYRLVAGADLKGTPNRDNYHVVKHADAKHILHKMAKEPARSANKSRLLSKAAEKLSPDWRPPSQPAGIIMLLLAYSGRPVKLDEAPAITPSQMRKLVEEQEAAITSLEAPEYIASGQEMVTIKYTFRDPHHRLTDVVLEIFPREDQGRPLWKREIPGKHLTEQQGSLNWNGQLDSRGDDFPDGFATLAASPYRIRLSAKDLDKTLSCEVKIHVEVAEVRLALAPLRCLTETQDQEIVRRMEAPGGAQVVPLIVEAFTTREGCLGPRSFPAQGDLGDIGDPGYVMAKAPWDDGRGPRIPLIATVLVKSSQKKPVIAGKALGRARMLWDYSEPAPKPLERIDEIGGPSEATARYLHRLDRYDEIFEKEKAGPPDGHNLPVRIGGKRGRKGVALPVFAMPDNSVKDFPFHCKSGEKRFWAAIAEIDRSGDREGQAGVVFRPSAISGDAYKLVVYVDVHNALDKADPVHASIPHCDGGTFTVWRDVKLVRFVRKHAKIDIQPHDMNPYTNLAYLRWVDECEDKQEVLGKERYTALLQNALAQIEPSKDVLFEAHAMLPIGEQYDREANIWDRLFTNDKRIPTGAMVSFRKYREFVSECENALERSSNSDLKSELKKWKKPQGKDVYLKKVNHRADALSTIISWELAEQPGVTIACFSDIHNLGANVAGKASFMESDKARSVILLFRDRAEDLAHELGHCLCLPHARSDKRLRIKRARDLRHVKGAGQCLMAYGYDLPGFCAICLLRLRGANGQYLRPWGIVP
jgi:hypothetical protein